MLDLPDRILMRMGGEDEGPGCWTWQGTKSKAGYGMVFYKGKQRYVHRVVYEHYVGPIPPGMQLDHLCRNRACCRSGHLEVVTNKENARRGDAGKATGAKQRAKEACPQGHKYAGANLIIDKNGWRYCRTCINTWKRNNRKESK